MKKVYTLMVALFLVNGAMGQWFSLPVDGLRFASVYFPTKNNGYAVGYKAMLKTVDAGESWTTSYWGFYYMTSIHCLDSMTCFSSAYRGYTTGGDGSWVLSTTDGYSSHNESHVAAGYSHSIFFINCDTGYVAGNFFYYDIGIPYYHYLGALYRTTDGGETWDSVGGFIDGYQGNCIFFVNDTIGFFSANLSGYPNMFKTTDGGHSWIPQNTGVTGRLTSIYFIDENTGYAVGTCRCFDGIESDEVILKTTDGGTNWTQLSTGTNTCLSSVFFTSCDTGYVVGKGGAIFKTIDGGLTWLRQESGTNNDLWSVFFTDADNGHVAGDTIVLKTTNGGGYPIGIDVPGNSNRNLTFYPNPASTTTTIETPTHGSLSIINTSGQRLLQQEITEPTTTMDVSGLKSGVYLVKVVGEKGVQVGKIIKE